MKTLCILLIISNMISILLLGMDKIFCFWKKYTEEKKKNKKDNNEVSPL